MWRLRLSKAWDWLQSRRLVGEDKHHLYYSEFIAKGTPERRYVEYKDKDITSSSDRMPIEWWSWLHNRRNEVPTKEELHLSQQKQQTLAERVAIIEAEDEKQRLRQFSGVSHQPGRAERRAQRRKSVLLDLMNASSPPGAESENPGLVPSPREEVSNDSRADRNVEEDPKGSGESFQPGSWIPSQGRGARRGGV